MDLSHLWQRIQAGEAFKLKEFIFDDKFDEELQEYSYYKEQLLVAGKILEWSCNNQQESKNHVDACKIWSNTASRVLFNPCVSVDSLRGDFNEVNIAFLLTIPSCIISILIISDAVHDAYANAFHDIMSVRMLFKLGGPYVWKDIVDNLLLAIDQVSTRSQLTILDIKRLEIICELIQGSTSEHLEVNFVSTCITSLINMQLSIKNQSNLMMKEGQQKKDFKSQCSSLRKAMITLCNDIINYGHPSWIHEEEDMYWTLCLNTLATPLLFRVGYDAHAYLPLEQQNIHFNDKIVTFLRDALLKISDYSQQAAIDILISIKDLASSSHTFTNLIFYDDHDIPALLVECYPELPKFAVKDFNSWSEFKILLIECFGELIDLVLKCDKQQRDVFLTEFLPGIFHIYIIEFASLKGYFRIEFLLSKSQPTRYDEIIEAEDEIKDLVKLYQKRLSPDSGTSLLHSLTCAIIRIIEQLSFHDIEIEPKLALEWLQILLENIASRVSRQAFFDDEISQIGAEYDLLDKLSGYLRKYDAIDAFVSQSVADTLNLRKL